MSELTGYGRKKDVLFFSQKTSEEIRMYCYVGRFFSIICFFILGLLILGYSANDSGSGLKEPELHIINSVIGSVLCIPILYYRLKIIYFIRKLLEISDEDEKQKILYEELISKSKKFKNLAIIASVFHPIPFASLIFDIWIGRSWHYNYKKLLTKKKEERVLYEGYKFFTENRDEIVKDGGSLITALKYAGHSSLGILLLTIALFFIIKNPNYYAKVIFIPAIILYIGLFIFIFINVIKAQYLLNKISSVEEESVNEIEIRELIENCKEAKFYVRSGTGFMRRLPIFQFILLIAPYVMYLIYFKELEFFKKTKKNKTDI